MKVYFVDAFTDEPFKGNKAGVVFYDRVDKKLFQQIAKEIGFSETVFCNLEKPYRVYYFTVTGEIDFCGHATLALMEVLGLENANLMTNEGEIILTKKNGVIMIAQPTPRYREEYTLDKAKDILSMFGLGVMDLFKKGDILLPMPCYTGLWDVIVHLKDENSLRKVDMNRQKVIDFCKGEDLIGFHFIAKVEDYYMARNFAPAVGIDEESATGSATGASVAYLALKGIEPVGKELTFLQGVYMGQSSTILARLEHDRVWVGGKASIIMEGEFTLEG